MQGYNVPDQILPKEHLLCTKKFSYNIMFLEENAEKNMINDMQNVYTVDTGTVWKKSIKVPKYSSIKI